MDHESGGQRFESFRARHWHETLRALARRNTLEEIEEAFGRKLGFAARSYILSIRDEIGE